MTRRDLLIVVLIFAANDLGELAADLLFEWRHRRQLAEVRAVLEARRRP